MTAHSVTTQGITLLGAHVTSEDVLTEAALGFVATLVRRFRPRITELLAMRADRQRARDAGEPFVFAAQTRDVREGDWSADPTPAVLADRRVEITGPVEAKMIVNALNSGANVFMADFEDSTSPTWENLVRGQEHLKAAVRRTLSLDDAVTGKRYRLGEKIATLFVRPRGLHLPEHHLLVDGAPAPGSLVDFGLYFFHNASLLASSGRGPFFYVPKLESHLEARLWADVFGFAEAELGVAQGSTKATVLIETLPAAFEMDEILFELRRHSAGLNCGRWDYIFSTIKSFRNDASRVLPDRSTVTMDLPHMRAYTDLVIRTCHRRGVHAMGGMAAQIPIKDDAAKNEAALAKVKVDKLREVQNGHDGTWVAHPGLVALARGIFDEHMRGPNQIARQRLDVPLDAAALCALPRGEATEAGLRHNIRVGVQYLESWLRGRGCVPLYHLMEDAATAEISRSQVWQWMRHGTSVEGAPLTEQRVRRTVDEELAVVAREVGAAAMESGRFEQARALFTELVTEPELADFLTTRAYPLIVRTNS